MVLAGVNTGSMIAELMVDVSWMARMRTMGGVGMTHDDASKPCDNQVPRFPE
jgi:hypothetical protein